MSFVSDRNPSPPPEILNNEELSYDRIGDTVYSKRWIIKTLMNIIESCDKPKGMPQKSVQSDKESEIVDIVELDREIEEDACTLWDMSASEQVAEFLFSSQVCNIFQDVIDRTKSPRLLEIVIGILANMCTFDMLCQQILTKNNLIDTVLSLTATTDTPSLLQVLRFIITVLKNKNCKSIWLELLQKCDFFMENIKDILSNSLKCTVIDFSYQVLNAILNYDYHYAEIWGQESFLQSIFISGELLYKRKKCLDNFFCLFNALCQYTPNVEKFIQKWDDLKPLFYKYIIRIGKGESSLDVELVVTLSHYFDSYNTLLNYGSMNKSCVITDADYFTSVDKILTTVKNSISDIQQNNNKNADLSDLEMTESDNIVENEKNKNGTKTDVVMNKEELKAWTFLGEIISETLTSLQKLE